MKEPKFHFLNLSFGVLIIASSALCNSDPCLLSNHNNIHSAGWRGSFCGYHAPGVCDKRISTGWYSVKGNDDKAYRQMVEGDVDMFFCGAINPISLQAKGSHPSVSDGIVNRTACLSGTQSFCQKNMTIKIKNCGEFYVYYLTKISSCSSAYCFGTGMECPKPDPCKSENHATLTVGEDRSTTCKANGRAFCDSYLKSNWYRVQYKGRDVKMPNTCVDQNSCSTTFPIWLHGKEPSIEDKVTDLKACVSAGRGSNCTCFKEYNIQVKNCTLYLVYNLSSSSACPERYCFGSTGKCNGKKENSSTDVMKYVYGTAAAVGILMMMAVSMLILYQKIHGKHIKVADNAKDSKNPKKIKPVQMSKIEM